MNIGFWNFYKAYNGNRMLESPHSDLGDDLCYPTVYAANRLRQLGHTVNTLDMAPLGSFDAAIFYDHPTFLDWRFLRLIARRIPLYLFANESPMHRPDNYWRCNLWPFRTVFSWRTVWPDKPKNVAEFRLPVRFLDTFTIDRTTPRKLLCAIFSRKSSEHRNELYTSRMLAIRHFEKHNELDLYGHGWDEIRPRFHSWRGTVDRKSDVMCGYKFALAYENSDFPGYVTEKIFDAMFAGCIPVYAGAQDIANFIPPLAFLEARRFSTYDKMLDYMVTMSDSEYSLRLDAIESFVRGDQIKAFWPEAFAQLMLRHVVGAETK
jgi:alpha(1,3/1,4) fucosyltransferase